MAHKIDSVVSQGYEYAEKFVTDVRMRAHNAAEAVYHSLPEMPQLPKLPQLPELPNLPQNVIVQMQHVRSTAVASATDAYELLQSKTQAHTWDTPYVVGAMSCLICLFLYKYISPALSARLCPGYNSLTKAKKIEWNTRTVSTLHALLTSVISVVNLLYEPSISEDPVWADSFMVRCTCGIVAGYMTADTIIMICNYNAIGEIGYIFHHAAAVYAYYFVISYRTLAWYANFRLMAEFSNPLVNQRWFMDVLGVPKTSAPFLVNGILMTIIFFVIRILTIPPYWMKVYAIYGTPAYLRLGRIWYVLVSSCIILDYLNLVWFFKIMRGCKKVIWHGVICARSTKSTEQQQPQQQQPQQQQGSPTSNGTGHIAKSTPEVPTDKQKSE